MQDWNGCSSLEQDNGSNGDRISITLTDKRDGNEYTVAKLKDGKCWMTQNLRIEDKILTSEDSDVVNNFYLPKSSTDFNFSTINSSHVWIDQSQKYGGYYSWFAATAGSGTNNLAGTAARYSICPKLWHLPSKEEGESLTKQYDATTFVSLPANFVLSGWKSSTGETISYKDTVMMYWTTWANGQSCGSEVYPSRIMMALSSSGSYGYLTPVVSHGWTCGLSGQSMRCISNDN